jgi:hypothetical protein
MKKMKKVTNIEELRNDQLEVYQQLRSGEITRNDAKEAANVAGKIMNSIKLEIAYNHATKKSETIIPFMEIIAKTKE